MGNESLTETTTAHTRLALYKLDILKTDICSKIHPLKAPQPGRLCKDTSLLVDTPPPSTFLALPNASLPTQPLPGVGNFSFPGCHPLGVYGQHGELLGGVGRRGAIMSSSW